MMLGGEKKNPTMNRAIMASELAAGLLRSLIIVVAHVLNGTVFSPSNAADDERYVCECCGRYICLMRLFVWKGGQESGDNRPAVVRPLTDASASMLRNGLAWISALICIMWLNYSLGLAAFWLWHAILVPLMVLGLASPLQRKELAVEALVWTVVLKLLNPGVYAGFSASITGNLLWWARTAVVRVGETERGLTDPQVRLSRRIEWISCFAFGVLWGLWSLVVLLSPPDEHMLIVHIMSWVCSFGGVFLIISYVEVFDVPYTKWFRVAAIALPCSLILGSRWAAPLWMGVPRITPVLRIVALSIAVAFVLLQRWLSLPVIALIGTGCVVRDVVRALRQPISTFAASRAKWASMRYNTLPALISFCDAHRALACGIVLVIAGLIWVILPAQEMVKSWLSRTLIAGFGGMVISAIFIDYITVRRYTHIRAAVQAQETEQQRAAREAAWRQHWVGSDVTPSPADMSLAEDSEEDDRGWHVSGRRSKRLAAWTACLVCFATEAAVTAVTGSFRHPDSPLVRSFTVLGLVWVFRQVDATLVTGLHWKSGVTSEAARKAPATPSAAATGHRRRRRV